MMLLLLSNKFLSGMLALIGYAPCVDKDEADVIVPMYGMPSSVYKVKDKADADSVEEASALSISELTVTPMSHVV